MVSYTQTVEAVPNAVLRLKASSTLTILSFSESDDCASVSDVLSGLLSTSMMVDSIAFVSFFLSVRKSAEKACQE